MKAFTGTIILLVICYPGPIVGAQSQTASKAAVSDALSILSRNLDISENIVIRSTGSEGEMMKAYRLLKQASDAQPGDLDLRYASICGLRLAAQFASSHSELEAFVKEHPEFDLARFTLSGWDEEAEGIAPAMFRYPECTPTTAKMPPFYARFVKTFVLLPARDGIYSRAVLFLKDNEAYWTREMMKEAKVEMAVIHEKENPQLAAIYARFLLPRKQPDIHETFHVLNAPKSDTSIAAISYLCLQDFADVVVMDNAKEIIFNQRVKLSEGTKATLKRVRETLLATEGQRLTQQQVLGIYRKFQNTHSLDDIEMKFFPPK